MVSLLFQVKKCDEIELPHGSLSCADPNGSFTFGSQCTATCDEGFVLNGTARTECNSFGMWSDDVPHCLGKTVTEVLDSFKCNHTDIPHCIGKI